MPEERVEVAIIGAGPAGSAAAIELARAGRHVLLLEKKNFPREKVCGGCLSGRAVQYLRRLLPGSALPGLPVQQLVFHMGNYRIQHDARGRTRVVVRSELDALLARTAAAAGADVRFGAHAALVRTASGWNVEANGTRIRPQTVLLAAGLGGARMLPFKPRPPRRPMVAQTWIQPGPAAGALPGPGLVEMHWLRGGYVGLATPAPGRCVVALASETPRGSRETVWSRLSRLNPNHALWRALPSDAPSRFRAIGTAGFPWTPPQLALDNLLLIGDAAGYAEPFSGEGIGQALCSAACAVAALRAGGDIASRYRRLMRQRHAFVRRRVDWIGRTLRHPLVHRAAEAPQFLPPWLLAPMIRWVHVRATA